MEYIVAEDKRKSEHLLLPLIDLSNTYQGLLVKPDKVFCYWENVCGIDCLEIGVYFKENKTNFWEGFEKGILSNRNLMSYYKVEEGNAYLFTVDKYYEDVDKFLKGQYSKFDGKTKMKIRNYWSNSAFKDNFECPKGDYYKIIFYPERYFEKAAEELGTNVRYLMKSGELMSKPNIEDETVNYKII